ncbi:MAG TPA: ShlB/FhaC/HecB family hemolysin secretion/activation protein [Stellaceae bacterium]|jgi:hemolysin activation/secretion protein|nr:ShlB/FhaC/HecB family hemolysin secretion/activation protein [Stellaceae bacterium]
MRRRALGIACGLSVASLFFTGAASAQAPATAPAAGSPSVAIKGIVFVPRPQDVAAGGVAEPTGQIDISRVPTLADPAAQAEIRKYLGLPVSEVLLGSLRAAVMKYYGSIDRPFVTVTVPKQDVTDGVVQIVVVEARLGKVSVEGNGYFSAAEYQNAIRLTPGQAIDNARLTADTDWLNTNQYRHAVIVATPGAEFGTTDLVVRAQDRLPLSVNFGFDDTGTKSTSIYRMSTGFDWGDAFWRGDDLNYEFTAAPDPTRLSQHALAYTFNLPWHDALSLSGSYATTNSLPSGITNTTGVTGTASLRYTRQLPGTQDFQQHLALGYDFKSTNNNILFGGVSVFPSTSEIDQFVLQYSGALTDPYGANNFTLTVVGSPGGMTAMNNNAAFQSQQAGATANYAYVRGFIERVTPLPWDFSWDTRLTAQISDAILLPSEQLIFGGYQSVRGFVDQGVTRDEGATLQNELRFPTLASGIARTLHINPDGDALVPFWFADIGGGRNHAEIPGTRTSWVTLSSTGPGLTWRISSYAAARFTWGIPLKRVGAVGPLLGPQFGLTVTF